MCSIIGYSGIEKVAPLLVGGLQKMEYRGYDSVGIATLSSGKLLIRKGTGKVSEVDRSYGLKDMAGRLGIGHTRWATHGGIIDSNAHPHSSCTTRLAIVHNGIIENHQELKQELLKEGHVFKSETDSEVIAHLLEHYFSINNDVKGAMLNTCNRLKGSFAFVAMFDNSTLCAARYDEPLIVGIAKEGYFISSDVLGFLDYTDRAIFLDNRDIVLLEGDKLSIVDFDGRNVERVQPKLHGNWQRLIKENTHTLLSRKSMNNSILSSKVCNKSKRAWKPFVKCLPKQKMYSLLVVGLVIIQHCLQNTYFLNSQRFA